MRARQSPVFAVVTAAALLGGLSSLSDAQAKEGQWMPRQIAEIDSKELQSLGLELTANELWNPEDGGLMSAIVNLGGCSAGFVSAKGLVASNHHCAHSAIQSLSSVDHDYLTDGFHAPTLADELAAKGQSVKVLQSIEDVTEQVRSAAKDTDPIARATAVERVTKEIIASCEDANAGVRCQLRGFYNGSEYHLFKFLEFTDIRLVYAPPSSIGNYGGEVDNWMWPRHTGDFSMVRVYSGPDGKPAEYSEDNVPYSPKRWLEVSPEGVEPGDFIAVLGYPGHTDRYLPAPEVERQLEQFLPARVDLYGEWIDILESKGAENPEVRIKVAATLRGFANRHKNARGMIEGIRALGLLDRRKAEESKLAKWAEGADEKYGSVLTDLAAMAKERRQTFDREFLIGNVHRASNALATAITLVRRAKERTKPDLERDVQYMDRGEKRLWSRTQRNIANFDAGVDEAMLGAFLRRAETLEPSQSFTSVKRTDVARQLAKTRVTDVAFAQAMFDAGDWEAVKASKDPMIVWARELLPAIEKHGEAKRRRDGEMLALGPLYFEMLRANREGPVYPDANGTLRLSYASVRGYSPADGLVAKPQTTLQGQVRKHRGEKPFDLPARVRDAAANAPSTYWADPGLGDVPVCFLSDADTTGGNSGSPVIDGKGRWVGLNFDRVWENIAGDFGYSNDRSRNIIVDIRYLLWTLDEVSQAAGLLEELGVGKYADAKARPRTAAAADGSTPAGGSEIGLAKGDPEAVNASVEAAPGCACSANARRDSNLGWLALGLVLLGLGHRRREHH